MDLSTTKKIKRRVLTINSNPFTELTNADITVSNWFQNQSLNNVKFKISSFYLPNTSIPCFIPRYIGSLFNTSVFKNKDNAETIEIYPNQNINSDTLFYWIGIRDGAKTYISYINMNSAYSEYPNERPQIHPTTASDQYKNRYYWFFNTSKFAELVASHIQDLIVYARQSQIPLPPNPNQVYQVAMTRTVVGNNASYGLYVDETVTKPISNSGLGFDIFFSPSLIELFQFKNVESPISTNLRSIIFNLQTRTYNSVVSNFVASNYVGDQWFPFDEIVFRSDLPIENIVYYDNANYIKQNYQNILLSFRLINTNPDGIYNFFYSEINPDSSWVSLVNNNSGENITFSILIRLKATGDLLPYTLKIGESANFITQTIETY